MISFPCHTFSHSTAYYIPATYVLARHFFIREDLFPKELLSDLEPRLGAVGTIFFAVLASLLCDNGKAFSNSSQLDVFTFAIEHTTTSEKKEQQVIPL